MRVILRKKAAMTRELVALAIFIIVLFAASVAVSRTFKSLIFVGDPGDTVILENFGNLVDEIEIMINSESVFESKKVPINIKDAPFSVKGYALVAFDKGVDTLNVGYQVYTVRENPNSLSAMDSFSYYALKRPESCGLTSCLCLYKPNNQARDKLVKEGQWFPSTRQDFSTFYDERFPICKTLPENVRFYSWSKKVSTYKIVDNFLQSRSIFAGCSSDKMILGFPNLALLSSQKVNSMFEVKKSFSDLRIIENYVSEQGYANFFEADSCHLNSFSLYIDKIDLGKIRDSGDDRVFIFLVPVYLQDKSTLESPEKFANLKYYSHSGDIVKQKGVFGQYSHIDIRNIVLSPLKNKDPSSVSYLIHRADDFYKIYYFLDYVRWALNPMLFKNDEMLLKIGNLGLETLKDVRQILLKHVGECKGDKKCLRKHVDTCSGKDFSTMELKDCERQMLVDVDKNENFPHFCKMYELEKEYISFFQDFFGEEYDKSKTNYYNDCRDHFTPEAMLAFVTRYLTLNDPQFADNIFRDKIKELESKGEFNAAYKLYIDFAESNKNIFYTSDGMLNLEYTKRYPWMEDLGAALYIRALDKLVGDDAIQYYTSNIYGRVYDLVLDPSIEGVISDRYLLIADEFMIIPLFDSDDELLFDDTDEFGYDSIDYLLYSENPLIFCDKVKDESGGISYFSRVMHRDEMYFTMQLLEIFKEREGPEVDTCEFAFDEDLK
jgi:hypothetical protein